mmetsp:Transcript_129111/g.413769  ORF Transcript_129111/g.413769 Transcript_129111/m.413769 type:complete len:207 (-) Transcript_129111:393-1013(-)
MPEEPPAGLVGGSGAAWSGAKEKSEASRCIGGRVASDQLLTKLRFRSCIAAGSVASDQWLTMLWSRFFSATAPAKASPFRAALSTLVLDVDPGLGLCRCAASANTLPATAAIARPLCACAFAGALLKSPVAAPGESGCAGAGADPPILKKVWALTGLGFDAGAGAGDVDSSAPPSRLQPSDAEISCLAAKVVAPLYACSKRVLAPA